MNTPDLFEHNILFTIVLRRTIVTIIFFLNRNQQQKNTFYLSTFISKIYLTLNSSKNYNNNKNEVRTLKRSAKKSTMYPILTITEQF